MENKIDRQPKFSLRNKFVTAEVYLWTNEKWASINQRTINGAYSRGKCASRNAQQQSYLKHDIRLEMTVVEFYAFCAVNESRILAMIANDQRPSIDRIDNDGHYTIDNIQIIPLSENMSKKRNSTTTTTKPKNRSKLDYQIANRSQYLMGQSYEVETSLVIDYYFKLTKDYKFAKKLIKSLIINGTINNPFSKANNLTIYADDATTLINQTIAEYQDNKNKEKELKELRKAKANSKQKDLEAKKAKLELTNSDSFAEVYDFILKRKHVLQMQKNDGHKSSKICNLDDRILNEKSKDLAIDIVANNIQIETKSIKEIRAEQPKPTHRNISWDSVNCMYIAQFTKNKIKYFVGRFNTEAEALIALNSNKNQINGER